VERERRDRGGGQRLGVAGCRQSVADDRVDGRERRKRRPQPGAAPPPTQAGEPASLHRMNDRWVAMRPEVHRLPSGALNSTHPYGGRNGDPGAAQEWPDGDPASALKKGKARMATNTAELAADGVPAATAHLLLEDRIWLLRAMLLMRGLEERAMTLYRQGKVPGSFYDGYGTEAVSGGAAFGMGPDDRLW